MEIMTPSEASAYLKISVITLAGWRRKNVGPKFIRTGRHIKYSRTDLDNYLEYNKVDTSGTLDEAPKKDNVKRRGA